MRCIALFVFYCAVRFHGMCELDRECEDMLNDMSVSVRGSLYFIEMTKTTAYIPSHLFVSSCSQS